ncbi:MAG: choice-of-anchor L domain-containing protein [Phycisphaerales bacterium]|nr:choice-of-anchor L domain-containing protein [Phycisphaerales bacterium]
MDPFRSICSRRAPCPTRTWFYTRTILISIILLTQPVQADPPPTRPAIPPGGDNSIPHAEGTRALTTQDLNAGLTPANLVTALLGPGVVVSNITFTGANAAAGTFSGGTGIVGFESGIILSSGRIAFVGGPNTQDDVSGVHAGLGDPDLNGLIPGYTTFDTCVLEFDFQCTSTQTIQFQYVFTSEEYNEWVDSSFNDVFGFFLNGVNIALVPGSQGMPVSINNVNCGNPFNPPGGSYCNLFINNDCDDIPPGSYPCSGARDTQMDGLLVVLTATGTLNPGVNHIKLAIADAGDQVLDSNMFIQGQSFVCGSPSGACCDTNTLQCTDNVLEVNCQGPGQVWTIGLNCDQLSPPCPTATQPDGKDCTNPIPITALPYYDTRTTSDKSNDYTDTCLGNYDNGKDILYELTITNTQCVDITVTGATPQDNWIGVAVDTLCPPDASCYALATSQGSVATISNLTLVPGMYYLMIDRWPQGDDKLDYTLSITDCSGAPTGACCNRTTQVCTENVLAANCMGPDEVWSVGMSCGDLDPPCATEVDPDGQDCEFPLYITTIPFDDVNTTSDKKEDYSNTCLGVYDDGDDIIYEIILTSAHCVDVTVTGATAVDHSIGVMVGNVCPPGLSCLASASTTGTEVAIRNLSLSPGTYYLMIDRRPDDEGYAILNYRLSIAECPAPAGACCFPGGQCAEVSEEDCTNAGGLTWEMDALCSPNPCVVGDGDGDGVVGLADFTLLEDCLTGPGNGPVDNGCRAFDLNWDDDVDLSDFAGFAIAFTGS